MKPAIAAVVGILMAGSCYAGESRFHPEWEPSARADLLKLLMMDKWTARDANFALDVLVRRLALGEVTSTQPEFLSGTTNTAFDAIIVNISLNPKSDDCRTGAAALSNPMRAKTSVSGLFCEKTQSSWSYDPRTLEVSSYQNQSTRPTKTFDVTDLGKVRPR